MWVRNQNGQKLLKVNHIGVETSPKDFGIVAYGLHSYVILGTYVCGDQAYGIMDEIQMRLNEGCPQVYQMPVDEVEANTVDESMIPENKDFYSKMMLGQITEAVDILEQSKAKREEVEQAIEKFKTGFKPSTKDFIGDFANDPEGYKENLSKLSNSLFKIKNCLNELKIDTFLEESMRDEALSSYSDLLNILGLEEKEDIL